jgi:hypothetical protein
MGCMERAKTVASSREYAQPRSLAVLAFLPQLRFTAWRSALEGTANGRPVLVHAAKELTVGADLEGRAVALRHAHVATVAHELGQSSRGLSESRMISARDRDVPLAVAKAAGATLETLWDRMAAHATAL